MARRTLRPSVRWSPTALRSAIAAALVGVSCGVPQPTPPAVDVTGVWAGSIEDTTPRGEPVYGTYTATFTLTQAGASVGGEYRAPDLSIGGSIAASVAGRSITGRITTRECAGTLQLSGTVRESPDRAAEMDVTYSGKTACAGEREGRGTLTKQ